LRTEKSSGTDAALQVQTVSPLTGGPASSGPGESQYRVEGSVFVERGFGVVETSGPRKERVRRPGLRDIDDNRVVSNLARRPFARKSTRQGMRRFPGAPYA
jgi:hypothetical protein